MGRKKEKFTDLGVCNVVLLMVSLALAEVLYVNTFITWLGYRENAPIYRLLHLPGMALSLEVKEKIGYVA